MWFSLFREKSAKSALIDVNSGFNCFNSVSNGIDIYSAHTPRGSKGTSLAPRVFIHAMRLSVHYTVYVEHSKNNETVFAKNA